MAHVQAFLHSQVQVPQNVACFHHGSAQARRLRRFSWQLDATRRDGEARPRPRRLGAQPMLRRPPRPEALPVFKPSAPNLVAVDLKQDLQKVSLNLERAAPEENFRTVMRTLSDIAAAGSIPNIETLAAAIRASVAVGDDEAAVHILRQALLLGLTPTPQMFSDTIILAARMGQIRNAAELLREMRRVTGGALDPAAARAVVRGACSSGRNGWQIAADILTESVTASAAAAAATDAGAAASSQEPVFDVGSFIMTINACRRAGAGERAIALFRLMQTAGLESSVAARNSAIAAVGTNWQLALQLLDEGAGDAAGLDVISFNTAINVLGKSKQWAKAVALLRVMRDRGVAPDVITYNTAISACAAAADDSLAFQHAKRLFEEMRHRGLGADVFSYAAAISACARAKKPEDALQLLAAARVSKLSLDTVTYTAALDACARGGLWREALDILDEMRASRARPNERTYRAAIAACAEGGQWERAVELLESLKALGPVNVIVYNSALAALVKAHQPARALALFDRLRAEGITPDIGSYSGAMSACSSLGKADRALALMDEMRANGIPLNQKVITSAISAAGKTGRWQTSVALLEKMEKDDGIVPDRVALNAVMNALRVGGQLQLALSFFQRHGGDEVSATDLVAAFTDAGELLQAANVYALALQRGYLTENRQDSVWELDLSGLPPPMARAKARYALAGLLVRARAAAEEATGDVALAKGWALPYVSNLTFITGTGEVRSLHGPPRRFNLSGYMLDALRADYEPSLAATVPPRLAGCLSITKETVAAWIEAQ